MLSTLFGTYLQHHASPFNFLEAAGQLQSLPPAMAAPSAKPSADESPSIKFDQIFELKIDAVIVQDYAKAIEEAKKSKTTLPFRKPAKGSTLSENEAKYMLRLANNAYEAHEWLVAGVHYTMLMQEKAGPAYISSRLALCHALLHESLNAYDLAIQGIKDSPAEAAAYAALAFLMTDIRKPKAARLWMHLASLGLNLPSDSLQSLEQQILIAERLLKGYIENIRPHLKDRNLIQNLMNRSDWRASLPRIADVIPIFDHFAEHPEELELTLEDQPGDFIQALNALWLHPLSSFPEDHSEENLEKLRQGASPIHSLSMPAFHALLKHLDYVDITRLQFTCKRFKSMVRHVDVYKEVYLRKWPEMVQVFWGFTLYPEGYMQGVTAAHYVDELLKVAQDMTSDLVLDGFGMPEAQYNATAEKMRQVAWRHHQFYTDSRSTSWSAVLDEVNEDSCVNKKQSAIHIADKRIWRLLKYVISDPCAPNFSDDMRAALHLMLVFAMTCPENAKNHFLFYGVEREVSLQYFGLHHVEACALIAVFRSYDTKLPALVEDAEFVFQSRGYAGNNIDRPSWEYIKPDGVWRYVMTYTNPNYEGVVDDGLMRLRVLWETNEMVGDGVDRIGAYTIVNGRFSYLEYGVSFEKDYGNKKIKFEGVLTPYGFGGHFGFSIQEKFNTFAHQGCWIATKSAKLTFNDEEWAVEVAKRKETQYKEGELEFDRVISNAQGELARVHEFERLPFLILSRSTGYDKLKELAGLYPTELGQVPQDAVAEAMEAVKWDFPEPQHKRDLRIRLFVMSRYYRGVHCSNGLNYWPFEHHDEMRADLQAMEADLETVSLPRLSFNSPAYKWYIRVLMQSAPSNFDAIALLRLALELRERQAAAPEDNFPAPRQNIRPDDIVRAAGVGLKRHNHHDSSSDESSDSDDDSDEDFGPSNKKKLLRGRKRNGTSLSTTVGLVVGAAVAVSVLGFLGFFIGNKLAQKSKKEE